MLMRWTKPLLTCACLAAGVIGTATAGESCSALGVNGVWRDVPCKELDRPAVCSKTTRSNGSTLIETVPCAPGEQKTMQQIEREEEAAQRRKCGKDFGKLRIGMALSRYEECTEALVYETDTVAKGGVVETYRSTFYWIHAKDGRIVAFTRR